MKIDDFCSLFVYGTWEDVAGWKILLGCVAVICLQLCFCSENEPKSISVRTRFLNCPCKWLIPVVLTGMHRFLLSQDLHPVQTAPCPPNSAWQYLAIPLARWSSKCRLILLLRFTIFCCLFVYAIWEDVAAWKILLRGVAVICLQLCFLSYRTCFLNCPCKWLIPVVVTDMDRFLLSQDKDAVQTAP